MNWWALLPAAGAVASFGSGLILGRHTIQRGSDREFLLYQVLFCLGGSAAICSGLHMVNP